MDIVALLEKSIMDLPEGDYSVGLNAITRHVKAAIRHLERDPLVDPDTCTDAIYRTNQAYEGSLKEAYRVLAEKDPSRLTPNQIEEYLEKAKVVRPRVLTQLTRYRQDYRNPSTHDYKLDFDEDEALLAIVSVCGFAKLLTNQIASKVASLEAQKRLSINTVLQNAAVSGSSAESVAKICLAYTSEGANVGWFEFDRGIADVLTKASYSATYNEDIGKEGAENYWWNVTVACESGMIGIDSRMHRAARSNERVPEFGNYKAVLENMGASAAVVILRGPGENVYSLYKSSAFDKEVFIICEPDDNIQFAQLKNSFGELEVVKS